VCTAVQEERSPATPLFPTLDNFYTEALAMCAGFSSHLGGKQAKPCGPLLQCDRHNSQMIGYVHGKSLTRHRCLDVQFV
jgi:hypothetical protein